MYVCMYVCMYVLLFSNEAQIEDSNPAHQYSDDGLITFCALLLKIYTRYYVYFTRLIKNERVISNHRDLE